MLNQTADTASMYERQAARLAQTSYHFQPVRTLPETGFPSPRELHRVPKKTQAYSGQIDVLKITAERSVVCVKLPRPIVCFRHMSPFHISHGASGQPRQSYHTARSTRHYKPVLLHNHNGATHSLVPFNASSDPCVSEYEPTPTRGC